MALELRIWFTDDEKEHDYDTLLAIGEKLHHDYKGVHPIGYDVAEVSDSPAESM